MVNHLDIDKFITKDDLRPLKKSKWPWKEKIVVPWGFYKLLTKTKEDYGNPPVTITENGYSSFGGINDDDRTEYYRTYLDEMLDAMEDGCDVRAYTAWSLMDNFAWLQGYSKRFGLCEGTTKAREYPQARKSAYVNKEMLRSRTLNFNYEPDVT